MNIYLVQHGKAYDKEENIDRPLNSEGRNETTVTANQLLEKKIEVSKIIHSDKTRAIETAAIIADVLDPNITTEYCAGLSPSDDVEIFAKQLIDQYQTNNNLMIVGHLPFLSKLASHLIVKNKDIPIIQFKNSGIICLKLEDSNCFLQWMMIP